MTNKEIIKAIETHLKAKFEKEYSGHDWLHIERVRKVAQGIAKSEGGDPFVIELGALLHDIADWKFHNGDEKAGSVAATKLLSDLSVPAEIIEQVNYIIDHISFKLGTNKHKMQTIEGQIVQDADRLDAIGAVGIARAFAYGGYKGRAIYDPAEKIVKHRTIAQAKKSLSSGTSVNHFYEKLLLLKDRMNTKTGKRLALARHKYMEKYLEQFFAEWNGKR